MCRPGRSSRAALRGSFVCFARMRLPDGIPLVVGGAGFIGSALVRLLAARGPVRVLDDLSTGKRENVSGVPGVELHLGSILDDGAVLRALRGVDVVFHLACLAV